MRRNAFGDAYCHTTDEALDYIFDAGGIEDVYVISDTLRQPTDSHSGGDDHGAMAEVVENRTGNFVCYLEASEISETYEMIEAIGLEIV